MMKDLCDIEEDFCGAKQRTSAKRAAALVALEACPSEENKAIYVAADFDFNQVKSAMRAACGEMR